MQKTLQSLVKAGSSQSSKGDGVGGDLVAQTKIPHTPGGLTYNNPVFVTPLYLLSFSPSDLSHTHTLQPMTNFVILISHA